MAQETERGEKTEEASPQRREDFRKRGQVAQTKELASVLAIFGVLLVVWLFGRFFLTQLHELMTQSFEQYVVLAARDGAWLAAAGFAVNKMMMVLAPVLGMFWAISFISSIVQVGFLYNEEALEFRPERLDPIQGFKRVLSLKSMVEGIKAIIKLIVISVVAYMVLRSEVQSLPHLVDYSVSQLLTYLGDVVFKLLLGVGTLMAILAGLDFLFQRWDLEKEMMMTKEEVKEEVKSREGDPLVRARIKRVQREVASRRMMEKVPKADVIVTNPTHIAVALKYDETMVAPTVIAKGADLVAEKIKALAREHNIPIVENKPLARAIYKTLKLGQSIPRELYTAVAEVLAYVFRLKRKVQ
ncbi:MAG: flagellar biosynthesis protein FlhB [Bdellovibrionales bacterium]